MAALGAALVAGGMALALNFKGCTSWHARKSVESVRWLEKALRHVPPWKQYLEHHPFEDRVAIQAGLTRVIGALFAGTGLLVFIVALVAPITTS